jgi:hypothetical protein
MKSKNFYTEKPSNAWTPTTLTIKSVGMIALAWLIFKHLSKHKKLLRSKPSWYFGVAGGANFNFYRGSTQQMNASFTSPKTFHDGFGAGLFIAPLLEYRPADSRWGVMLQAGYDSQVILTK